jgi:hypothetical protein
MADRDRDPSRRTGWLLMIYTIIEPAFYIYYPGAQTNASGVPRAYYLITCGLVLLEAERLSENSTR